MQGVLVQKANDLPVFVQLMICKDRKNYLAKKEREAQILMGLSDDRVLIKQIAPQQYKLENEYADSRATQNTKVSKTIHLKKKTTSGIKTQNGLSQLKKILRGNTK